MSENVDVAPDSVSAAKNLMTSSGDITTETASKMTEVSNRQTSSKWTALSETGMALTRSQQFADALAARMREAAHAAELYTQMLMQTHDEFQTLDEAGQQQMTNLFTQLEERSGLGEYARSVDPYLQREQVIAQLEMLPEFLRNVFLGSDAFLTQLMPDCSTAERDEVRGWFQNSAKKYFAIDEYISQRMTADTNELPAH